MERKAKCLWMKDILEHLERCFDQWQAADPRNERFLIESMERDLDEFRRLCRSAREPLRSVTSEQAQFAA